ncbi:SAV_915 family protein [Kitasatospora sp. NPDC001309]|uniref:SAV_915 family protein n=1 Tax=Kitasatospora sp. NPDC001309 TaxID=3364013 RepID=UPI0036B6F395
MQQHLSSEDPEPSPRDPAGPLLVPVRSGPLGHTARIFRTALGDRTAVAFTTPQRLTAVLGPAQPWIALAEPALRALTEPLGITTLTVDPQLAAPAPAPSAPGPSAPYRHLPHPPTPGPAVAVPQRPGRLSAA